MYHEVFRAGCGYRLPGGTSSYKIKRKLQDMPRLLDLLTDDRTGQGRAGYQAVISRCAGILSGEFAEYKA